MATNEKYRIGIIGCGGMGGSHSRSWQKQENVEIVAAMDIYEESAKKLAAEYDIPATYTDVDEMLAKEDLDIVSITTWQGPRSEATVAAAKAGVKGIMGEKPMSASLGQADEMLKACEENDVKLVIGHQRRYRQQNTEIRRLIADGAIGQPTTLHHRAKAHAGLLNTGTHAIDTWRYMLSDPETLWVIGQTARTTDRWERRTICEDLCMGLVCFEGGTRAIYEGDLPDPPVAMPIVAGTEGQIREGDNGIILLQNGDAKGWQEITPQPEPKNQFQELIQWIEGEIPTHRGRGEQGRYTIEIMMAIYESLRIKDVVRMPLETKELPLELMVNDGTLPVLEEGRYDLRTPFEGQTRKR
ncbi:Gfo/Idh/MocA family oxidoreductase [Candidatus Poribacteria bacterium]|nr:Gfo/Idh/MocA family oxidoreductase [Candidatus Poribacteria bacterium]